MPSINNTYNHDYDYFCNVIEYDHLTNVIKYNFSKKLPTITMNTTTE